MSVRAGQEAEYKRRHDALWPEMAAVLKEHGVHAYSIFLHPTTGQLFASVQIEDEERWGGHRADRGLPALVGLHARHHGDRPSRPPRFHGFTGSFLPALTRPQD